MIEEPSRRVAHRADQCGAVDLLGQLRHDFAELDAGHFGSDRLEVAADIGRGVRLRIPDVDMARTSLQVNHQDLFGRSPAVLGLARRGAGGLGLFGLEAQYIGQAQTEQAGTAEAHKFSAAVTVAGGTRETRDRDHVGMGVWFSLRVSD